MTIQVLGSGCASCKKLFLLTKEAVKQLKLDIEVEYSTDVSRIIEMGLMSSPVLAINGKPAFVGFIPDIDKIKKIIKQISEPNVKSQVIDEKCKCGGNC